MSRRQQRQEEKEEFLDQNPQLIEYESRIEVGRGMEHPYAKEVLEIHSCDDEEPEGPYVAQVTQDGEPLPSFTAIMDADPSQTLAAFVDSPAGFLSASGSFGPEILGPPPGGEIMIMSHPYSRNLLSLSENGFGVAQSEDMDVHTIPRLLDEPIEGPEEMSGGNDYALDGEELLVFEGPFSGIPVGFIPYMEDEFGHGPDFGLTGFGIDFTVLNGQGTVEMALIDFGSYDEEPMFFSQAAAGTSRRTSDGSLEADLQSGDTFDVALISVTGTLEIAVTGIDVSSNFDGWMASI